jgi:hypothetical protein
MKAPRKDTPVESLEYLGDYQRLRIRLYTDGVARLCFRAVHWGSIHTNCHPNQWKWVGDYTPEEARHVANLFRRNIDELASLKGMKVPQRKGVRQ